MRQEINEKLNKLNCKQIIENPNCDIINNLKKTLESVEDFDIGIIEQEINEIEKNLTLVNNNINFLKQRNQEFKVQHEMYQQMEI